MIAGELAGIKKNCFLNRRKRSIYITSTLAVFLRIVQSGLMVVKPAGINMVTAHFVLMRPRMFQKESMRLS